MFDQQESSYVFREKSNLQLRNNCKFPYFPIQTENGALKFAVDILNTILIVNIPCFKKFILVSLPTVAPDPTSLYIFLRVMIMT